MISFKILFGFIFRLMYLLSFYSSLNNMLPMNPEIIEKVTDSIYWNLIECFLLWSRDYQNKLLSGNNVIPRCFYFVDFLCQYSFVCSMHLSFRGTQTYLRFQDYQSMYKVKTRKLNYWLTLKIVFVRIDLNKLRNLLDNRKLKRIMGKNLNMFVWLGWTSLFTWVIKKQSIIGFKYENRLPKIRFIQLIWLRLKLFGHNQKMVFENVVLVVKQAMSWLKFGYKKTLWLILSLPLQMAVKTGF